MRVRCVGEVRGEVCRAGEGCRGVRCIQEVTGEWG